MTVNLIENITIVFKVDINNIKSLYIRNNNNIFN